MKFRGGMRTKRHLHFCVTDERAEAVTQGLVTEGNREWGDGRIGCDRLSDNLIPHILDFISRIIPVATACFSLYFPSNSSSRFSKTFSHLVNELKLKEHHKMCPKEECRLKMLSEIDDRCPLERALAGSRMRGRRNSGAHTWR